jgi:hypothetical protein
VPVSGFAPDLYTVKGGALSGGVVHGTVMTCPGELQTGVAWAALTGADHWSNMALTLWGSGSGFCVLPASG